MPTRSSTPSTQSQRCGRRSGFMAFSGTDGLSRRCRVLVKSVVLTAMTTLPLKVTGQRLVGAVGQGQRLFGRHDRLGKAAVFQMENAVHVRDDAGVVGHD